MSQKIFGTVRKILCEDFNLNSKQVDLEYKLSNVLGISDIGFVSLLELIRHFEDAFDIQLTDEEVGKISTVGDAVECIRQKLA